MGDIDSGKYAAIKSEIKAKWRHAIVAIIIQFFTVGGALAAVGLWAAERHFVTYDRHVADLNGVTAEFNRAMKRDQLDRIADSLADLNLELQFSEDENEKRLIRAKIQRLKGKRADLVGAPFDEGN